MGPGSGPDGLPTVVSVSLPSSHIHMYFDSQAAVFLLCVMLWVVDRKYSQEHKGTILTYGFFFENLKRVFECRPSVTFPRCALLVTAMFQISGLI